MVSTVSRPKPEKRYSDVEKVRECLVCGEKFTSEHFGERVCESCKRTVKWRVGDA